MSDKMLIYYQGVIIMLKKYKPYIVFFYLAAAVALVLAAFFDLDIDKALNNPSNPLAVWLYNTGEIPGRLICPLAGAVLFYTCKGRVEKIISLIIQLGGSAYLGYYIGKHFFVEENQMLFSIVYGLGVGTLLLLAGKYIKLPDEYIKPLRTLAVFGIIIMFAQIGLIEGMKYLWGRVRFRDLLAAGSYDAFTPWYKINGINGNKSFPSGHTAGAGMSYILMLFPLAFDKYKNKTALCFLIPCAYTSLVAYTRLVMGAHYLSDVTVGGIVSFTIVLVALAVYQRKYQAD